MGEEVAAFEREFAAYVGSKHAIMVNSGSSANLLAVAAVCHQRMVHGFDYCGGGPYEDGAFTVVVPAIAWATTYAPLNQYGFALRVIDVDPKTLNATTNGARGAIRENTVGIVGCSVLGHPAPVDTMRQIADARGIFFIEDNCESMGARIGRRFCGTFGHIGTFSTFFSHHISTGEGGFLVTDDDKLHELAVCLRAHGWARNLPDDSKLRARPNAPGDYQFVLPGYNLRPTELAAAVGRVQLRRLNDMNLARIKNWVVFLEQFGEIHRDIMIQHSLSDTYPVPFGFTLVFKNTAEREEAAGRMHGAGIEYRMITGGCLTEHPSARLYNWCAPGGLPHAQHAHHCGLFVGNHPVDLTVQIGRLVEVLR